MLEKNVEWIYNLKGSKIDKIRTIRSITNGIVFLNIIKSLLKNKNNESIGQTNCKSEENGNGWINGKKQEIQKNFSIDILPILNSNYL